VSAWWLGNFPEVGVVEGAEKAGCSLLGDRPEKGGDGSVVKSTKKVDANETQVENNHIRTHSRWRSEVNTESTGTGRKAVSSPVKRIKQCKTVSEKRDDRAQRRSEAGVYARGSSGKRNGAQMVFGWKTKKRKLLSIEARKQSRFPRVLPLILREKNQLGTVRGAGVPKQKNRNRARQSSSKKQRDQGGGWAAGSSQAAARKKRGVRPK